MLKKEFNTIVNKYLKVFETKQELYFDYWVGDYVGEIAVFGDFFFNFDDIRLDIDNNIVSGKIIDWYDWSVENEDTTVNYKSWVKGYDKLVRSKLSLNKNISVTLEDLTDIALQLVKNKPKENEIGKLGTGKIGILTYYEKILIKLNLEKEEIKYIVNKAEQILPEGLYVIDFLGIICPDGVRYTSLNKYIKTLNKI